MKRVHTWLVLAGVLVALAPAALAAQQPARISGRVTDENGAPLGAASVFIPALRLGTLTQADGTYTLTIPANRLPAGGAVQVTAQLVGRRSLTQPATLAPGGTATLNFELATDVLQLEGVVATGVGTTTTRERLGVAIATVNAQELTRVTTPNVVEALAAKAPGVQVTSSSGDPGAATYIRVRGINTIEGSGQPLFVVDGVPIDNSERNVPSSAVQANGLAGTVNPNRASDVNANDIASIEILKGAAASAIYGARAASGVVLITTKSGQAGQPRATLSATTTIDQVNRAVPLQRRWAQGSAGNFSASALRSWGPEITGASFDHWGELFEDGTTNDVNLAVSGGNERTSYYLSIGRIDQNGVITGDNDVYDRTSARLKGSHQMLDNLTISGNFAYAETNGRFVQKGSNVSGLMLGGLRTPPSFDNCIPGTCFLNEFGFQRSYTNPDPTSSLEAGAFDNPFWVINENRTTSDLGRAYGNISVVYEPFDWASLSYTLGNDYSSENRLFVLPIGNYSYTPGYLARTNFTTQQLTHTLVGSADRELGPNLQATFTAGYDRNSRRFRQFFTEGYDLVVPDVFELNNTINRFPDEYRERVHAESFFGQVQGNLYEQLYLTAAVRNDGFSTFGASTKRHWFPKFSAAWTFTEALGLSDGSPLSFGKLRAAWGQAGNEPPVYGTIGGYTSADLADAGWDTFYKSVYFGRGGYRSSTRAPQPDLGPERTSEFEAGLDLSFFRQRVGLELTYYNARTDDAIFAFPVAASTGFEDQLRNAATIRNRGVEVSLDADALQLRNFAWNVGVNWSKNNNKVLSLGSPDVTFVSLPVPGFEGSVGVAQVGFPIGVLQGNDFYRCGNDELPDFVTSACAGAPQGALYIAASGFPLRDPAQRIIADPTPDWQAGIRNTFTLFNDWQLYALIDVRHGGDVWNGTKGALLSYGTHGDTDVRATCTAPVGNQATGCTGNEMVFGQGILPGAVAGPGAGKAVPIGQNWYQLGLGSGFNGPASQFIEDGGFVKLREVALSYNVPATLARRVGMTAIDLRVAGRNLRTWTDYTGIDPETNLTGNTNLRGYDYFNNPQSRSWIFTVNLTH
ncbi:MAG TPA: SusC/RagA family TonB-linked outer membrane protein [Longimicrobiaceae bacterium]|jgi:TonB-linked SusC/RagA family outer membrane protein|nr:SusC/RagA family TonB-linked outer membrane protein [Longimicrobiaceae bacterium]